MARSEANAVGNKKFTDLNMSHYPDKFDSRDKTNPGFNPNISGYENLKDYNMAEHVNALADAVMAIERILGINPHIDKDGVDQGTVDGRIDTLESKNYDKRYGGPNWKPDTGNTIEEHKHLGQVGGASKIDLTKEVQGLLPKNNINLTANGLTGADIRLTSENATSIEKSIVDKLSMSLGGEVKGNTLFSGKLNSMFDRTWLAEDATGGSIITDYKTATNKARRVTGKVRTSVWKVKAPALQYGDYAICVRARVDNPIPESLIEVSVTVGGKTIKDTIRADVFTSGQWKSMYPIMIVEGNGPNQVVEFEIAKLPTSADVTLDLDYLHIMPAHPGIFDK